MNIKTNVTFYAPGEKSDWTVPFTHSATSELWDQIDEWLESRGETLRDYVGMSLQSTIQPIKL